MLHTAPLDGSKDWARKFSEPSIQPVQSGHAGIALWAVVLHKGLNLDKFFVDFDSNYVLRCEKSIIQIGLLNNGTSLSMSLGLEYDRFDSYSLTKKHKRVTFILNPKLTVRYKMGLLLGYVYSDEAFADFFPEIKNYSFWHDDGKSYKISSFRQNVETVIHGSVSTYVGESNFSNKTMKFISESCEVPFRKDDRFHLTDIKNVKAVLDRDGFKRFKLFWNGTNCPVKTATELKSQFSSKTLNFFLSNTDEYQKDDEEWSSADYLTYTTKNLCCNACNAMCG